MRREYVCTISSHAAPSPARHLRTSSAPSLTANALTAPTVSLQVPVSRIVYDRYQSKVQVKFATKRRKEHIFSVQPLCSLCLCGGFGAGLTTETQRTQRLHREELCLAHL